jgi:beta-glucosidase/6-phospho-beta-glucosidase/beta-galactosidase
MGNDYYLTNEHLVHEDGSYSDAGEVFGYYVITHQYFDRFGLPIMHTETNIQDESKTVSWLLKQWANVYRLRQDGVPVVGFTWYSLTDQVDWDNFLRNDAGIVNQLGLADLDRRIRPVGAAYKRLIQHWDPVMDRERYLCDAES